MTEHYGSGTWDVREGHEAEFVQRWTEFITWSRSTHPEMLVASLLSDRSVPGHYVSFAEWSDPSARDAWKRTPEFAERFSACAALCANAKGADYDLVVTI
jgi:quinol monooxygenase YgiN